MTHEDHARLESAKQGIISALNCEADLNGLSLVEMLALLALLAFLTGAVLAGQDARVITRDAAIEMITANIQLGNAEAVAMLRAAAGPVQ